MKTYLLDTNIISLLLRRDPIIERRIEEAFAANESIVLSPVVLYEIRRGLLKRDSKKQMGFFERLIPRLAWRDSERVDWELAAHLWAEREKMGRPIEDADLLIAAQAKRLGAILVTDNEKDFEGLGVTLENWRGSKIAR
jgi:tRNA(fMet)-specific endonuclease VapC